MSRDTEEAVDEDKAKKQAEARRLADKAKKAMEAFEDAERRRNELKNSNLSELAAVARKYMLDKDRERLSQEAKMKKEEAERLAQDASNAEKKRGTSTLAQKLSVQSRSLENAAREAERKAELLVITINGKTLDQSLLNEIESGLAPPLLSFSEVVASLKNVPLIPASGARSDISMTVDVLDELKRRRQLALWKTIDYQINSGAYRGSSSVSRLLKTVALEDGDADMALGVRSYKALQTKNMFLGSLMFVGGIGLLAATALEGGQPTSGVAQGLVVFGYSALLLNLISGFFVRQTNTWVSKQLFALDIDDYRRRAVYCEAAHFLVAYICGLPFQEYSRSHVGYPLKRRPTGRVQVFSSCRGDPDVRARGRPFGLPPWVSLEKETAENILAEINPEPLKNGYTAKEIDTLSLVLLAGPVAEFFKFGASTNGEPMYEQLDTCMLMSQTTMDANKMQAQARWAIIRLVELLKNNQKRLDALVEAMKRESTLIECIATIESTPEG